MGDMTQSYCSYRISYLAIPILYSSVSMCQMLSFSMLFYSSSNTCWFCGSVLSDSWQHPQHTLISADFSALDYFSTSREILVSAASAQWLKITTLWFYLTMKAMQILQCLWLGGASIWLPLSNPWLQRWRIVLLFNCFGSSSRCWLLFWLFPACHCIPWRVSCRWGRTSVGAAILSEVAYHTRLPPSSGSFPEPDGVNV